MWIVDTCVVLDVLENDPQYGRSSAEFLQAKLPEGLAISPVSMVELSPAFDGDLPEQKRFLDLAGIRCDVDWTAKDTETANQAWNVYVQAKRSKKTPKRPIADLLIGAFASRWHGLITRNPSDFRPWFPHLRLQCPVVNS